MRKYNPSQPLDRLILNNDNNRDITRRKAFLVPRGIVIIQNLVSNYNFVANVTLSARYQLPVFRENCICKF